MINIGIIGCGRIAGHHCEAIKKIRGLKTVAVCDLDFTKAQELAKKYKAKAKFEFANNIYAAYDKSINSKYKIELNNKAIERIKNSL